jgi:hypothetical protein
LLFSCFLILSDSRAAGDQVDPRQGDGLPGGLRLLGVPHAEGGPTGAGDVQRPAHPYGSIVLFLICGGINALSYEK